MTSMRIGVEHRRSAVDRVGRRGQGDLHYAQPMPPPVQRVCLLGAESTGKTTLAEGLARRFGTLWNPEYGRPYTEIGRAQDAPWTSAELTHIARMQCWYEDFLAGYAHGVLFCDTDAFTTAVFHEAYLGSPATAFAELTARPYDLFLVCGLDVPFAHDGIREFEAERERMHALYLEHARLSGAPWLLLEGGKDERLETAAAFVGESLPGLAAIVS
jgi:HTH-type transcriptional regulator, transcriptional repressor of NAD biosynthesis genes